MTAYDQTRAVERRCAPAVKEWLVRHWQPQRIEDIQTEEGQKLRGDWVVWPGPTYIEAKFEERDSPNIFAEQWSNLSRYKVGWMHTLQECSYLLWFFEESGKIVLIDFQAFRAWAFRDRNLYRWAFRKQGKYDQMNDTWGWLVPISQLTQNQPLGQPLATVHNIRASNSVSQPSLF